MGEFWEVLVIDIIYPYPGLRTEAIITNQHLHSALYFDNWYSGTFSVIKLKMATCGPEFGGACLNAPEVNRYFRS